MKRALTFCMILVLACAFLLTSCGELSGKYTNTDSGVTKTYEFAADRIKYYTAGVLIYNGEYTLKDELITVNYTLNGKEMTFTESFFDYGDKIEIGGEFFTKE